MPQETFIRHANARVAVSLGVGDKAVLLSISQGNCSLGRNLRQAWLV